MYRVGRKSFTELHTEVWALYTVLERGIKMIFPTQRPLTVMNMFLPWVVGMISQVYTQVKTHGIVYIKYVKVFVYQLY